MRIGIPRALAYYAYFPFIITFFEKLGCNVIVSDITTKETMDMGVQDTITDACVPLKLFHGHVRNIKDRVDYVFTPRLVSVNNEATFCPKFLGLPDMLACSIEDFDNPLEIRIDLEGSKFQLFKLCVKVAKKLNKGFFDAYSAYNAALRDFKNYMHQFLQGGIPPLGVIAQKKDTPIKLGVIGYPYMLYDPYLSLDLIKKLMNMGVYVITPEMIPKQDKLKQRDKLRKTLFWTFSNDVLRTGFHFLDKKCVDGIIHITAFACGPDFAVDKVLEIDSKNCNIPYLTITLDEHTGQEGLNTRLEAFVDMITIKKKKIKDRGKEAAMA